MSRLLAVLLLALLVLVPGAATAAPPNDFVTGGGQHAGGVQFTVSAHSGPAGEDPHGQVSFKVEGEPRVRAEVTCLVVAGNQAFVTATYTDALGQEQTIVLHAVDNGEPSDAAPDLLRVSFSANAGITPDPNNPGCFLPVNPPVPVEQGNIVVNDAPAV